jgi:hypothetical protein
VRRTSPDFPVSAALIDRDEEQASISLAVRRSVSAKMSLTAT